MQLLPVCSISLFIILLLPYSSCSSQCSDCPVINTKHGSLRGLTLKLTNGRQFYAFRRVPFAKPPLGPLRFKAPLPAEPWDGILDATNESLLCPQYTEEEFKHLVTEDCLTLDIYTPKLPSSVSTDLLPVLFFIHGGSFIEGSNRKKPLRLINKDIVLVVGNYRLGSFGFLSTGDASSPGNFGLLDQVLALQWIRDNIGPFGGDANRVTINGNSAGSACVIFHMVSPKSRGLFRGVIAQSGTVLNPWTLEKDPISTTIKLGREVNCSYQDNNSENLVQCLREKSIQHLIDATRRLPRIHTSSYSFLPVIENSTTGQFLTESPYELLRKGQFHKVPLMIGATRDEMGWLYDYLGNFYSSSTTNDFFFNITLPASIRRITTCDSNLTEISAAVKAAYFDNINGNNRSEFIKTIYDMYADSYLKAGIELQVKLTAAHNVPVFTYLFEYPGNGSKEFLGEPVIDHSDDLRYLFYISDLQGKDQEMSDKMVDWWTNFVTTLNPTPNQDDCGQKWTPTPSIEDLYYLKIGKNCAQMKNGYLTARANLWNRIILSCQRLIPY